ncbi:TRAFAC clade GTPase domain-containing protein [Sorangium atrum]|uniref:Double-GTPase 2 domain-containing protein n=1 Tax=Sorangium atrum TaxID=2995308 RepID=A0ABT5C0M1_9BACT|nr:hypothetical protein [Sorangium aterium]MDC0679390.1 hypothetical protein [Sorangium aterium]
MADAVVADAKVEATGSPVEETEPEFIDLFSGTVLGATDAEAITLRSRTHLVVFAGAEGSGKTTVLASIYERLNQGPFAGFRFAGSRSLPGFEEICHLNRLASGGVQPDTQRTRLTDETKYYHLVLRGTEPSAARRDVLLSAMSGELFRMAKDSLEDAERLTFLRRADTIVVLVDGERLAAVAQRTSAQADAADILESLLDAKLVSPNCQVEIVFSKLDRITAAGKAALEFLSKTQEKFEGKFRARVPNLAFKKIAARPAPSSEQENSDGGLAEAFVSWTRVAPPASLDKHHGGPAPARDEREFSKFGWRHFERTWRDR